jgi:transposase
VEVIDIEETDEAVDLVERVCALDIGKAALTMCIPVPHDDKPGHRRQEVREHATTTRSLLGLADRLHTAGVTLVAMQATSDDWKPAFYLLKAEGFTCWLRNAKHAQERPRPAQDRQAQVRCGWPRWWSGACAGPASCRHGRFAGCVT